MATGGIDIRMDGLEANAEKLRKRSQKFSERMIRSIQAAANRAKEEIESQGRENIRAGGNFSSPRWQEGFQAKVSYQSRQNINIRVTHDVFYWRVFENGATIFGKPLLWIPLSGSKADLMGVRARDFGAPLFRVDRINGVPLLHDGTAPQYFGKESVTIPKKWNLRTIVRRVARRLGTFYREAMKDNG
jgi:hypothetical protein